MPAGGWAGFWLRPARGTLRFGWTFIGFIPTQLDRVLEEMGYSPAAILRAWKDNGWLIVTQEGGKVRNQQKVRIGNDTTRVVAIRYEAVREVFGEEAGRPRTFLGNQGGMEQYDDDLS
jgi:hypothetical protein